MSQLERRQFLKLSALAAATTAAAARANPGSHPATDTAQPSLADLTWDKAPCRFCGTGCHVKVGVKNGKIAAIAGHEKAAVNQGLLCVKGYHVGAILYGKDRLTTPLLRKNGELTPVSWDEALDLMADRIMQDPAGFAFYGSGQWTVPEGYAAQKLMKAGLSNNHIDPNARLCMASAVTGYVSTYGVDEPAGTYDDLDACDVVICWGNNPAEMHPILFSRLMDRRSRGETVRLIDIGTRRTRTTEFADDYLEFRPQTDLAIANCIANQLIANGTFSKEYVEKFCNFRGDNEELDLMGKQITFDEYKELVASYTPEAVSKLSGLSVDQLTMLGELFGDPEVKITSLWCMGVNQHTRGTAMNRLLHAIHLLSGHFGTPGNAPTSLTGQPSACGTAREVGTLCHALPGGLLVAKEPDRKHCEKLWNLPDGRINPKPGYHTVLMWEKFCTPTAEGGDIHTMFVQVTNPGQSLPHLQKLFRNKEGLEDKFLVVSDGYPTASTELADLVLPAAMWVEKNGVFGNSERRTQQWFKMVDPPGEAREDVWMTIALARKLYDRGHPGMKDKDGEFLFHAVDDAGQEIPFWDYAHFRDINVDRYLYEEYRPFTHKKHKNVAPYDELAKTQGLRWPVVQTDKGTWRETRFRFAEFDDPFVEKGRGIQFYHSTTGDDRAQIWFCPYEPHPEEPDDEFPFWLCTGRVLEHWHTGTMTMRVPQLANAMPDAYAEIHPDDAAAAGISNGQRCVISTRRGEMEIPVWTNGRGRPPRGSIFVPFFDERQLINVLTLDAHCPISKEPDYKKCAARIRPV
ncbi:molybdopterin-dependent oxidoreductase [Sulfuriroseicoccus oceanibius]|uniref:Nitrate reductase n=1 Tax=Sulfuriroseicoccus oceanibius TaxID=2707525 RepID=A0A6B3LCW0_9BACT|nr:molybdopterin-dependent oxidoreductase [Sulfuriroseicoccus oceanibius]QQL44856.1 molybdopterin-dependent oxidoreductase [Sulfuriroseicoccus oceanibius]